MYLKPQDIVLALSLLKQDKDWTYAELAKSLEMSASEVHSGVKRLLLARLLDPESKKVRKRSLLKFLIDGVPYAYAAFLGEYTRGIPTAWAAPALKEKFSMEAQNPPIWPDSNGKVMGLAIKPLYRNVMHLAKQDSKLYDLLALVDTLRIGRAREKNLAEKELKQRILANA